jgi:hypothetical protein
MTERLDQDLLAKILGLLGSDHAGERAAAGLKAHELVRAAGLTWRDVLDGAVAIVPQLEINQSWDSVLAECCVHKDKLSARERDFVVNLARRRGKPSPKQITWLSAIYQRLKVAA